MAKDFDEFVSLTESDEYGRELDEVIENASGELEKLDEIHRDIAISGIISSFELRKYHEWVNS